MTQNLEAALRVLWIDSICIDQMKESSEQVLLMGRIYHQCTRGLICLDTETDRIQRAMELIQRLTPSIENEMRLSELREDEWRDIEAMIGANPVWSRVLIVQELYFCA